MNSSVGVLRPITQRTRRFLRRVQSVLRKTAALGMLQYKCMSFTWKTVWYRNSLWPSVSAWTLWQVLLQRWCGTLSPDVAVKIRFWSISTSNKKNYLKPIMEKQLVCELNTFQRTLLECSYLLHCGSDSSVFWLITRCEMVWNRRFRTIYLSHRQGSRLGR